MKTRVMPVVVALALAGTGCSHPDGTGDLPAPRRQAATDPACQQPTLATGHGMPDCEIPGDACKGATLVVEVSANGQPSHAYVAELRSKTLEECLSSALHEWVFIPAKDCAGAPLAGVWKEHYAAICGDTLGPNRPKASLSAAPRSHH
jgi:hypothetical protein